MGWGASLMRLPAGMTMDEIAAQHGDDWELPAIGTIAEIGEKLKSLFPDAWQHPDGQTTVELTNARVTFNYGDRQVNGDQKVSEPISSIGVEAMPTDESIDVIRAVCEQLDLRMVDHQNGQIADFEVDPKQSMKEYKAFRDRAIEKMKRDD